MFAVKKTVIWEHSVSDFARGSGRKLHPTVGFHNVLLWENPADLFACLCVSYTDSILRFPDAKLQRPV